MILVDSDVFLIDLRYQRDQRFGDNRAFLDRLATSGQGATTIYNLLEVCGVLSFNLNRQQLRELYAHFARRFHIRIVPNAEPRQRLPSFRVGDILSIVERRVSFEDALVFALLEAQKAEDTTVVTWNARHFRGRTEVDVREPPVAL
ncbi:MAG: hypothetical protein OXP69_24015 [Spirochaetaceae bacterium]|nr:hypothetical protein [Spirochaetaceae bacterium]